MVAVTIPKEVTKGKELIVVSKKEFEEFKNWKEGTEDALAKVKRGRAEYKAKKTVVASSPKKFR